MQIDENNLDNLNILNDQPIHPYCNQEHTNIYQYQNQRSTIALPYAKSLACSTEKALEWDEAFKKNADESGRAVLSIHNYAQRNPARRRQNQR